jgi:hypothetical protein
MYDVVGTLGVKQAWGDAKLSGAIHQISSIGSGTGIVCVHAPSGLPGSCPTTRETGWAGLAGVTFMLPQFGSKDQLILETSYADGAIAYTGIFGGAAASPNSFERVGQTVGGLLRSDADAHAVNNGNGSFRLEKEKVWALIGQFTHYWNPNLRSNLIASGYWLTPGTTAQNTILTQGGMGKAQVFEAGVNVIWGSRKTAEIGIELDYKKLRQDLPGGGSVLPAGIDKDPSGWAIQTVFNKSW